MDEEDLALQAESRQLETAQNFAAVGGIEGSALGNDDLFGLFMNDDDTMGVKILQKMGWRRDQGVGRKVRRSALLDDKFGTISISEPSVQHLFAPQDIKSISYTHQDGRKGLGYQSEARLNKRDEEKEEMELALPFMDQSRKLQPPKKPAKKSSFGVGVLNDTGSDDDDPYEIGPKITFNKTIGKDKKAKKPSKFARPGAGDKVVFVPKKVSTSSFSLSRMSQDGKPPLRGFILEIEITYQAKRPNFKPPQIPPGWKSAKGTSLPTSTEEFQSVSDAAKASTLDAKARASLLGETLLPGKSIFDFISKENRDRIATITGKADLPQGLGQAAPKGHKSEGQKDLWSFVPTLDKDIAAAALAKGATGWMPYAEDLTKRARYVRFLELRAGTRQELPERAENMSVSDWAKELQEFAHAAQVFKPTSGIMASRFTSSTSSNPSNSGNSGDSLLRAPVAKPEDPAEQAAKLGMYGAMTRSQLPFHPSRLLCKRFNVAPPVDVPYSADTGADVYESKTQEAVSKPSMDRMMHEVLTRGSSMQQRPAWMNQPSEAPSDAPAPAPPPIGHATVDVEDNEALSKERAPEEVFKAIFGDSDDDE
jgi:G patch domain-containing protein 1